MQKICLVIPCYNEEKRLDRQALKDYISSHPDVCFLAVNDGSRDGTLQMLNQLEAEHPEVFRVYDMPANAGKAEAVRNGMLQALNWQAFDYIGYWDADFSTPLTEIDWFIQFCGGLSHQFIMGSRVARLGSQVQRKILRHYLGRVFSTVTSNMLKLRVYDTQCGAKLVDAREVSWMFEKPFVSKWFFDVELLARMVEKYGREAVYLKTMEVPLRTWLEIKGSKLRLSDFIKVPLELLKIRRNYRLG